MLIIIKILKFPWVSLKELTRQEHQHLDFLNVYFFDPLNFLTINLRIALWYHFVVMSLPNYLKWKYWPRLRIKCYKLTQRDQTNIGKEIIRFTYFSFKSLTYIIFMGEVREFDLLETQITILVYEVLITLS